MVAISCLWINAALLGAMAAYGWRRAMRNDPTPNADFLLGLSYGIAMGLTMAMAAAFFAVGGLLLIRALRERNKSPRKYLASATTG